MDYYHNKPKLTYALYLTQKQIDLLDQMLATDAALPQTAAAAKERIEIKRKVRVLNTSLVRRGSSL